MKVHEAVKFNKMTVAVLSLPGVKHISDVTQAELNQADSRLGKYGIECIRRNLPDLYLVFPTGAQVIQANAASKCDRSLNTTHTNDFVVESLDGGFIPELTSVLLFIDDLGRVNGQHQLDFIMLRQQPTLVRIHFILADTEAEKKKCLVAVDGMVKHHALYDRARKATQPANITRKEYSVCSKLLMRAIMGCNTGGRHNASRQYVTNSRFIDLIKQFESLLLPIARAVLPEKGLKWQRPGCPDLKGRRKHYPFATMPTLLPFLLLRDHFTSKEIQALIRQFVGKNEPIGVSYIDGMRKIPERLHAMHRTFTKADEYERACTLYVARCLSAAVQKIPVSDVKQIRASDVIPTKFVAELHQYVKLAKEYVIPELEWVTKAGEQTEVKLLRQNKQTAVKQVA